MHSTRFPLHPAQQDVFTDQLLNIDSPQYNLGGYIILKGHLNRQLFHEAVNSAPKVFDTFKMRFDPDAAGISGYYDEAYEILEMTDLDFSDRDDPREDAKCWMQNRFNLPFAIQKESMLFEHYLVKIADDEYWFFGRYHHLITDGYGFIVWVQYLARKYRSLLADDSLEFSYPAYFAEALKSSEYKNSSEYEAEGSYWKEKIIEKPQKLLQRKYANQDGLTGKSSTYILDVSPGQAKLLENIQLLSKSGLQQLTIAAMIIYFGKTSGQSAFIFGIPVHKRNSKRLRNIVGMFSGILPFKASYQEDIKLSDLLKDITISQKRDYRYQNYLNGDLSRYLKINTSEGYLSEVIVNYEPLGFELDFGEAIQAGIIRLANEGDRNPLQLCWRDYGNQQPLQLQVHFSYEYFNQEEIDLLAHRIFYIISQFPDGLDSPVGNIDILPNQERILLETFNNTQVAYPQDKNIRDLFEEQVFKTPQAVAVVFEQEEMTYKELNERSNQLAHYLRTKAVGRETLVPICLERSLEMIVGILGILKAGAAYVPVDPQYPEERISYMLNDVSAGIVISSKSSSANLLFKKGLDIIELDGGNPVINSQPVENLHIAIEPTHLAYVIYTSGSTGTPKGAMNEHGALVNRLLWAQDYFRLKPDDSILQKTTFCFDVSVWELIWPLLAGARLVFAKPGGQKENDYLKFIIEKQNITVLHFVPSMLGIFLPDLQLGNCKSLRKVLCSGESLKPWHVTLFREKLPGAALYNLYGPTEAAIDVTCYRLPNDGVQEIIVPIGKPVSNTAIYILDKRNNIVPTGCNGEIHIGGVQVGRGYLNLPELTAEKFIANPFSEEPGARMYKTGDIGRWLPDGNIEYLGRIDDQVKIRGYRIEPGEIETVLRQSAMVTQVAVIAKEDDSGNMRLIGYIVPSGVFDKKAIRSWLEGKLPGYMIPSLWVSLDELPLTANGKTDRKALPDPNATEQLINNYAPPGNEIEKQLCSIWEQLLATSPIGIDDNFFELGGDSLITLQVVSRARQLGYIFQPKDIFYYQTISRLAKAIAENSDSFINAEQGLLTGLSGLLPVQQWYLEKNPADISHFNQSILFSISKEIPVSVLTRAIAQLTAHHDALRFTYYQEDGEWKQEYGSAESIVITEVLQSISIEETNVEIRAIADRHHRSLDIEKGELLRVVWIQMPEPEAGNRLLIVIHHLAIDGVSWRILTDNLELLLGDLMKGSNTLIAGKSSSYRQWFDTLAGYGQSAKLISQGAYWQEVMNNYHPFSFDKQYARLVRVKDMGQHTVRFGADQTRRLLQEVPRVYHTEINDILLCALANTLCGWSNRDHIVIGLEGHGREHISESIDITRTVGWFTSIYPVHLNIGEANGADDLIKSVKEQLRLVPDRGLGFGVLKHINKVPALQGKDPWDILFNYLGQLHNPISGGEWLKVAEVSVGVGVSEEQALNEKLVLNCHIQEGILVLNWSFSSRHFHEETIKTLAASYLSNLELLVAQAMEQGESGVVYTPSDYGLGAEINYKELDRFLNEPFNGKKRRENIDSLYRLSALQQGMLFQGLYDGGGGTYINQFGCDLPEVDLDILTKSWDQVLKAHSILRSAFYHDVFSVPVQCVYRDVQLPLAFLDYRGVGEMEQAAAIKEYEAADRRKGFDFKSAPLMRLGLIRLSEERYLMLWTSHHILFDGWSWAILIEEFLNTYETLVSGNKMIPAKEDRFEDYIRYTGRLDKEEQEKYWRNYLKGVEQSTLLPFIRTTAARTMGVGVYASVFLNLDAGATAKIQHYSQRHRLTVNTVMQGVWSILLHRYTSGNDIVYGVIESGRPDDFEGVEKRVGMYINTLPFHAAIRDDQKIVEWLQEIQDRQVASRQYQHTPFQDIQAWTGIQGDFFDSLLVFLNYPVSKIIASGKWKLQMEHVHMHEQNNFPLTITIGSSENINISFTYNTALLQEVFAGKIRDHFERVLLQITDHDVYALRDIELLSQQENRQLLVEFNDTFAARTDDRSIVDLFEDQVLKTPQALAVVFEQQQLTFKELNERSNQLGHYLKRNGIQKGTLVPLFAERGVEMIIGILGILKAGGAYVPVDLAYPMERIRFMLDDTHCKVVISSEANAWKLQSIEDIRIIELNTDSIHIGNQPVENLLVDISTDDLAYVIYTSGSTGNPKGVMIEHGHLFNYICNEKTRYVSGEPGHSGSFLHLSYTFDASLTAIFMPLLNGRLVVIGSKKSVDVFEDENLWKYAPYDFIKITPSHLELLQPKIKSVDGSLLTGKLVIGGEALHLAHLDYLVNEAIDITIVNEYGPTEATVGCSTYIFNTLGDNNTIQNGVPIGKPIDNVTIYILGEHNELMPVGVGGEICIGGAGLARGYLNRDDLTAEKFINNPWSNATGHRLYKTGDLGRWLPGGNIEYLGRKDDQVKIRGYRIELGEIEIVLGQCELVKQAVVLAIGENADNRRLVGYIVAEDVFDKVAINAFLLGRLPVYMIPSLLLELESLPLTSNGKIDRKFLASTIAYDPKENDSTVVLSETEEKLTGIWKELLELDQAGLHDDFFELGGHSLLAVRVISAIRRQFAVELTINEVFEFPTIALMATQLESRSATTSYPAISVQARPGLIPLSFSQERLWFIDQLEGSLQYHVPAVLGLKGKLNKDALAASLQTIINRHEALRTVIREKDGQGYQYIMDEDGWRLDIVDGSNYKDNNESFQQYIQQFIRKPFDLSGDYMLRASLIRLDDEKHVLAVAMHHIASDAWSMAVIVKEVIAIYSAYCENRQAQLPKLELQYADYAIWQRNYLIGDLLDKKVQYWKEKLEAVPALQLPTDFIRPAARSTRGASASFLIEKKLLEQVHELSQKQGSTLFMTLLAAFNVLLYRYSGQQDISVGTSIGNRPQQEVEGLVGFFVNTLALRSEVLADRIFTELLQQVKATTLEAYEHQEVPFEKVVEAVVKDRDPGRSPLFQVMLVLLNTPEVSKLRLGDVELTYETFLSNISKFDITFFINETSHGLQLSVEYSTDLYREETILRMMDHFNILLESVVKTPGQKIGLLPMLTAAERRQLLEGFNESKSVYPKDKSIVALFEEQVEKTPASTAVVFEQDRLTYGELNERSNQLAHYLRTRGVKAGSLVPVCMDRSADMLTAILGILKAGGAYVPIDIDFPPERISYMLEDTAASIVVSSKNSSSKLWDITASHIDIIELDGDAPGLDSQPLTNLPESPSPHDLAYVIYTSGSTGQPKGVMIEHRNLVDYVFGLNEKIRTDACRSFALVSTIATDLGNTVIYSSLLLGGALHLFSKETVSNAEALHHYFKVHAIDCLKIVPSHWKVLCMDQRLLLPARLLVFGGEALQAEMVEDIRLSGSGCAVVNHYGPTETTIGKLLHIVNKDNQYNGTVPIGKPFSNTRVYVLSKDLELCPVGVLGQLYIAGDGVARGYLNNDILTHEKFINNPFSGESLSLMYGTGDLVKWLPDGNILFAGRADDQVKIRGYRVELGEIESVLQQSELVSQAVVLAREDKQGNKRLVGYIVADGWFDREGILSYLKDKLPEYMVPALLMELDRLPLTANGKVDRKALPDPDASELLSDKYAAPRNEAEMKLAAIWQDVLELEQVGIHDDFFELGGHSLLAIRLISAIRKELEAELPISDIFDYPTIALLSERIHKSPDTVLLPFIDIQARPEQIPLSFSQERLWFIDRLEGSVQYHVPAVLRLKGKLDIAALAASLQEIINRHEVLRTVIYETEGQPYQYVNEKGKWELEIIDGTKYRHDTEELQKYIERLISNPFDLSKDHMLRASVLSFDKDDHVAVLTLHHIASDGWSKSILVRELVELYNCYVEGMAFNLPPLPVQYADFAIWQRGYLQEETLGKKLGYWKKKLDGVQALQLPSDYTRPAVWSNHGAMAGFSIGKDLSEQLQSLSHQQAVTLFMTLISVFKVLLHRYSGQEDICVGTPVAGRPQHDLEGLIGFFVNTLALRSEVSGEASFIDLLQQVKSTTMEAYGHQEVPFEKVVDTIVKERDLSRNPLFQVMFILRNTPEIPELRLGGVKMSPEGYGHKTSMFDIAFFVTETSNGLDVTVEYNTDLYKEETIVRFAGHYKELLASVVKEPGQRIALLPMLSKAEQEQVLIGFNKTGVAYPKDLTIIDLFEDQVSRNPEAVAVVFEEQTLTYKELNERSNQLAHYLRTKGVKEETPVPVCISRSPDMIVGILGILKAGGAYIPIDPEYPLERITYMLEDTGAAIVLSSRADRSKLQNSGKADIVEIDGHWATISRQPAGKIQSAIKPHHLAYVIYTSGSTGKPKGVMIEHHSLYSFICWCRQEFFSSHFGIVYATTSICFDLSVFEIFYR